MTIVTLITDFGLKDGNVGVMKGVILSRAPDVQIVDLSHLIQPQDILEAGLILRRSAPFFPPWTIHVVVVDPGVGTQRRPIAGWVGKQFFVAPDNGVITMWLEYSRAHNLDAGFVDLDRQEYWLDQVSHVFHGRDIFAPVAGSLASGVPLDQLGTFISDPVLLNLPRPMRTATGWIGEVIHIDHFGNISTNITNEDLTSMDVRVRIGKIALDGLVRTFGDASPGDLVALFGSTGNLLVCEVNGSAAKRLQIRLGTAVTVEKL